MTSSLPLIGSAKNRLTRHSPTLIIVSLERASILKRHKTNVYNEPCIIRSSPFIQKIASLIPSMGRSTQGF